MGNGWYVRTVNAGLNARTTTWTPVKGPSSLPTNKASQYRLYFLGLPVNWHASGQRAAWVRCVVSRAGFSR